MKLFEAHHAYWGLIIMMLGFAGIAWLWQEAAVVIIITTGFVIFADDVYQHLRQRKQPGYLSPLHRYFYWVVRWINGK